MVYFIYTKCRNYVCQQYYSPVSRYVVSSRTKCNTQIKEKMVQVRKKKNVFSNLFLTHLLLMWTHFSKHSSHLWNTLAKLSLVTVPVTPPTSSWTHPKTRFGLPAPSWAWEEEKVRIQLGAFFGLESLHFLWGVNPSVGPVENPTPQAPGLAISCVEPSSTSSGHQQCNLCSLWVPLGT
jgi:hypothetical protein